MRFGHVVILLLITIHSAFSFAATSLDRRGRMKDFADKSGMVIFAIYGSDYSDLKAKLATLRMSFETFAEETQISSQISSMNVADSDAKSAKLKSLGLTHIPSMKNEGISVFAIPTILAYYNVRSCQAFRDAVDELNAKPIGETGFMGRWIKVIDTMNCD